MYYAYQSSDGHTYLMHEELLPWLMLGDFPLFDTAEDCIAFWASRGLVVDRYA